MKKYSYILLALMLALSGCRLLEEPEMMSSYAPEGERVQINFRVAVPDGGVETKAMGLAPSIDPNGFYVAVFGGSGYFNEWVQAEVTSATANYDNTLSTVYDLSVMLSVSDSRLRLHFIANCPSSIRANPPISGSQDTEDNIMSKIRSQLSDTYNDGYWQKIILPNGVKAKKNENDVYVATNATMAQFPNPIVMVRNFARVYLRNLTPIVGETGSGHQLVTIKKFGLAYAPSEGLFAPMLSAPYTSDSEGHMITIADNDETTPFYYENFFINYQDYPIASEDPSATLLTDAPFNYRGYSPADQAYNYYPNNTDKGSPVEADLRPWDSEHPENNILFVYERTVPSADRRATRVIILAERIDQNDNSEGDKFYALDIVNSDGVSIPLLRNQTYTVHLLNIESGSGETDITKASTATSATVSGDPNFQNLINISDGKSSIGTSFTEQFYVQPQEDYVMFRYIPTNIDETLDGVNYTANKEYLDLVSFQVGSMVEGAFTPFSPAQAASDGNLSFAVENGEYKVWIDVDNNNKAIPYVRSNNTWVAASSAQIDDMSIEKWGKIKYQLNNSYIDEDNYFTQERSQIIHIVGLYNEREMSRNVVIKTSPRQTMHVSCLQKYVMEKAGEPEVVRIFIPTNLSRSLFPLEFDIEADGYSLTPDGDELPVAYGTSIIPDNDKPSFYFVKTLSQERYNSLPTTTIGHDTWKVFDCHFKTTLPQNECTVYVSSRFFSDANANDAFYNFSQRQFTWQNTPTTAVYKNGNVSFEFVMDLDHDGNPLVWWDPLNSLNQSVSAEEARQKGLSTSNRVLPPIITVTLDGFVPQYREGTNQPETTGLEHSSGNTYLYYVGTDTPLSDMATVVLMLKANGTIGNTGKVTLSTVNIEDNPDLYEALASSDVPIEGASFSNVHFTWSNPFYETNDPVSLQFSYQSGLIVPVTIDIEGAAPDGTDARITSIGNSYRFTPTAEDIAANIVTYTIGLRTTGPNGGLTAELSSDSYYTANASHAQLTEIALNKTSMKLIKGTNATLTASFTPNNINPTPVVTWTSSNESVATVSSSGVVTAVNKGTATITARAGSRTATCSVKVGIKRTVTTDAITTSDTFTSFSNNSSSYTYDNFTLSVTNVKTTDANYLEMGYYTGTPILGQSTDYNGTITITPTSTLTDRDDFTLTNVRFTYVSYDYAQGAVTPSIGTYTSPANNQMTASWSGSTASAITFTMAARKVNYVYLYYQYYWNRLQSITITYTYMEY